MESEADRAAAPAPAAASEASDDAIQEESAATAPGPDGKPGSGPAAHGSGGGAVMLQHLKCMIINHTCIIHHKASYHDIC